MILTTGFEVQGYFITEYIDVIFDEILVGLGLGKSLLSSLDNTFSMWTGTEATAMIDKLNSVKKKLRDRVIQKAEKLGANALIGIDFESSKLGELIMVSMTATAVKVDKIVSPLPYMQSEKTREEELARKEEEEEDRKRRQEEIKNLAVEFNSHPFLDAIQMFKTTKEIVDFVKTQAITQPDLFDDTLMAQLQKCANSERIYGSGVGREEALIAVRQHLDAAEQTQ